jgi:hypothetical protein
MFSTPELIQVYLDTGGILKDSQINNSKTDVQKILNELYKINQISILSAQGSYIDIWGENDSKVISDKAKEAAFQREKTRLEKTFPLASYEIETKNDFDENSINLYGIMNNREFSKSEAFEHFSSLPDDDNNKVDFLIIRTCINDANYSSYFITTNSNDFIKKGKKEKLEFFAENLGKSFKIRLITKETLEEIKEEIKNI